MERRAAHHAFARLFVLGLGGVAAAACGLGSYDEFYATQAMGGAGGAGSTAHASSSSSSSSSSTSTSSSTSASSSSTSASSSSTASSASSASSSSGTVVCGDGVCSPNESAVFCPQDCGGTSSSSSSSSGMMGCDHDTCDTGGALQATCNACTAAVCATDPFCCQGNWDQMCVNEANTACGTPCCGNGKCNANEDCNSCPADCGGCPPPTSCPHGVCETGAALTPQLCHDPCVDAVCAQQPNCCGNASWSDTCHALAGQLCAADPCVTAVCGAIPACCTAGWSQACVDKSKQLCQTTCGCNHPACQTGEKLDANCSPCVKAICKADSFCCDQAWDGICVNEVASVCNTVCQ